jgi:ArsR family transcriptional regulator, arsenate/arsenite/antimonite-responsive transcriptional repressor
MKPMIKCVVSPGAAKVPEFIPDESAEQELATLCKALAHPARVRILKILIARQYCICGEIVQVMSLAQSTVSEHLRILKQAGLVQGDVDGPRICYCIHPQTLARFKSLIEAL